MRLGMVGLGRMGSNMAERLLREGHEIVGHDRSPDAVATTVVRGGLAADSLAELVAQLPAPRVVWLMVPAGVPTQASIDVLEDLLSPGDVVIDGGNSNWKDTQRRFLQLQNVGITLVDCGVSGGIWGLQNGYCLMIGGPRAAFERCEPIYASLAPPGGYLHVSDQTGAGHFVKMVHNGIEYAMMQSYGEGFEILEKSPFQVDHAAVAGLWNNGSVVRSWLLELLAEYLSKDARLEGIEAYVDDSGEGRWTVDAAVEFGAPAYAVAASLFARFASRDDNAYGLRVLAALRRGFGGHPVKVPGTGEPVPTDEPPGGKTASPAEATTPPVAPAP